MSLGESGKLMALSQISGKRVSWFKRIRKQWTTALEDSILALDGRMIHDRKYRFEVYGRLRMRGILLRESRNHPQAFRFCHTD